MPLSEAKTRLHDLVRDLEGRDVVLLRHGRPVAALLGFRRYRELLARAEPSPSAPEASLAWVDERVRAAVARLCRRWRAERLVLFGSAARGKPEPGSDLDLLVRFRPMAPGERAQALFGLEEDLERALGRPVDLMEEEAIRNPFLRRSIEQAQVVLYEAA